MRLSIFGYSPLSFTLKVLPARLPSGFATASLSGLEHSSVDQHAVTVEAAG